MAPTRPPVQSWVQAQKILSCCCLGLLLCVVGALLVLGSNGPRGSRIAAPVLQEAARPRMDREVLLKVARALEPGIADEVPTSFLPGHKNPCWKKAGDQTWCLPYVVSACTARSGCVLLPAWARGGAHAPLHAPKPACPCHAVSSWLVPERSQLAVQQALPTPRPHPE